MTSVNRGLEGVNVAETEISSVDGVHGELVYAGYTLEEIVDQNCSYEDVFFLLLNKRLPSFEESKSFAENLANRRTLTPELEAFIDEIPPNLDYMDALRTGISALSYEVNTSYPPTQEQAMDCMAKAPLILSRYFRRMKGEENLNSNPAYSHAENYLYLLTGKKPDSPENKAYAKALETYFISTIEHGMNASTFTARVTTSTQSDLLSSVTAALSTLKGPLHGGAPLEVIHMLDAIGTKKNAEAWIRNELTLGRRLMGFGHRIYRTYDPRAKVLQDAVKKLPVENNHYLELSLYVEEVAIELLKEFKPNNKLYTNVEFGAATILRAIGLPEELYPATFGLARCGGWMVHSIEACQSNRLIRPSSVYMGAWPEIILQRRNAETAECPPIDALTLSISQVQTSIDNQLNELQQIIDIFPEKNFKKLIYNLSVSIERACNPKAKLKNIEWDIENIKDLLQSFETELKHVPGFFGIIQPILQAIASSIGYLITTFYDSNTAQPLYDLFKTREQLAFEKSNLKVGFFGNGQEIKGLCKEIEELHQAAVSIVSAG